MSEEAAEEGRLLYVALTRARHRLVVWWVANTQFSARTKLHQLLTGGGDPDRPDREAHRSIGRDHQPDRRGRVPARGALSTGEDRGPGQLERARLDRPLDYFWRRVSFSSLSPDRPLGGETDTKDEPDRVDEPQDDGQPTGESGGLLMEQLPRGAEVRVAGA